jgi:hypothetical protein
MVTAALHSQYTLSHSPFDHVPSDAKYAIPAFVFCGPDFLRLRQHRQNHPAF